MYTVIFADDEEELRKAILQKIDWNSIGFEVIGEAENGAEALELVEKLGPDLLLTDIKMPFVSGIELARQAREIRPYMQIAFLSGYESFAYAQQAIQYNIISYLLKPISAEELTDELIRIREKLDTRFLTMQSGAEIDLREKAHRLELMEFLMPIFMDQDDMALGRRRERRDLLEQQAVRLEIRKPLDTEVRYLILVTSLEGAGGENCTKPEQIPFVDSILKKYVQYGSVYSGGKIISILSAGGRSAGKYIHILVTEILQSAERILGMKSRIGVSREFSEVSMGGSAYSEALAAMHYVPAGTGGIQFISDIESGSAREYEYIEETVTKLDQLIKTGSRSELEKFLAGLFSQVREDNDAGNSCELLVIQILATVYRTVNMSMDNKVPTEILSRFSFLERGFTDSIDEVQARVIGLCRQAQDIISNHRKVSSELLSDKAIQIIDAEFGDEMLTLVSLSERLHISSNYLSATIKKNTGETFISLLTRRRMEKAKEYLLCTPLKIQEIAGRCGYSDQHYFSYCFKKYYGKSPNKMRESAAKAEN